MPCRESGKRLARVPVDSSPVSQAVRMSVTCCSVARMSCHYQSLVWGAMDNPVKGKVDNH